MTADNEMCVVVTQTARVAAADAVKAYRDQRNGNWQQRIRDGKCDDGEMVQAFARFEAEVRIATTADLQARLEAAEGLSEARRDALHDLMDSLGAMCSHDHELEGWSISPERRAELDAEWEA